VEKSIEALQTETTTETRTGGDEPEEHHLATLSPEHARTSRGDWGGGAVEGVDIGSWWWLRAGLEISLRVLLALWEKQEKGGERGRVRERLKRRRRRRREGEEEERRERRRRRRKREEEERLRAGWREDKEEEKRSRRSRGSESELSESVSLRKR
jgi:hypothetical protein